MRPFVSVSTQTNSALAVAVAIAFKTGHPLARAGRLATQLASVAHLTHGAGSRA
jgi:hypothetical protein